MQKTNIPQAESKSADLLAQNIEQLKQIFPEVIKEGKVDFEALHDLLGNYADTPEERFALNWAGKANARHEAQKRSTGTLRPCPEDSVDWDSTENLYIEGDNLEVLKLMQKSYHSRVKMIYIDPPYNTGKDFVYKDNYTDNIANYLEQTGQDKKLSTNTESDGRYHSNWLNMMYPRLKLARNLLTDDGVIFISIDDNEVANLRKVCDEIFGEENFVGNIIWQTATDNNPRQIATEHEYVICYAKNLILQPKWLIPSSKAERIIQKYNELKSIHKEKISIIQKELTDWISKNADTLKGATHYNYVDEKGVYYPGNSSNTKPGGYTFNIVHPITNRICKKPDYGYRWTEKTFWDANEKGDVEWGKDETVIPKIKKRINTVNEMLKSSYYEDNRYWTKYLNTMFGRRVFENPKSVNLLIHITKFTVHKDSIILDFFSGSATTAHAVMQLNAEDGGNRKYICVQLPEQTPEDSEARKAGYATIPEIAKERIRRAGKKILEEQKSKAEKEGGLFAEEETKKLDIGFKVFKLDSSNINAWDSDPDNLETALNNSLFNIKTDRSEDDLLYEIIIKYGIELTEKINRHSIDGKTVYEMGAGSLIVCLADSLSTAIAEGIGKLYKAVSPEGVDGNGRVVFKEAGFNGSDEVKTNTLLILKQHGITNVATV